MSAITHNHPYRTSRRSFLNAATVAAGTTLLAPSWLPVANSAVTATDQNTTRIAQILSSMISVDMHNHVYPAGTEPHPNFGHSPKPDNPPKHPELSLDLATEMKHSGLTAVCASFVLDFAQNDKPGDAWDNYVLWLTAIDEQLEKGHMHRALTLKDLQVAHERNQPTIVQTVEGAMFIEGRLERIEGVYKRGVRHLQLLHMKDDLVSPLGDVNTVPAHLGGLTPFGASVIEECNRLGIVVDLAHASHETVLGALRVVTEPFIISHTSLLDANPAGRKTSNPKLVEMMKPHLITKEHAKVVADAGGVVGVWTKLADSLPAFVENIKAMADAIGIDHVGIGTDTDLLSPRDGQGTNKAYPTLPAGFFPAVVGEMLRQGFAPEDIDKVGGGNFCRILGKVTTSHA